MNVKYDIHAHTHLSLCGQDNATIANYVKQAKENGVSLIGIADHMWDKEIPYHENMRHAKSAGPSGGEGVINWYKAQPIEHCRQILAELNETDNESVHFVFGGEVDYCPGLGAAITRKNAEMLDFMIVPNSHTHHVMDKADYEPYQKHADFMLRATMEICTAETAPLVTALAHPFDAVCCPYPTDYIIDCLTDSQLIEVFSAANENNIAAEINGASFECIADIKNSGVFRVLAMAKKAGCLFTFGSDSHSGTGQSVLPYCSQVAELLGLTESDILPCEKMLSAK